ncbi:MAG: TM0106 family RecB-like putative nuclease [Solirubrobacteraceae bacterium]
MYRTNGRLLLSPSDLNNFVACRHLTALDLAAANGEIQRPDGAPDPTAELVARKGDEHERSYLAGLRERGKSVVEIPHTPGGLDAIEADAAATAEAMRAGAEVIYQATFLHDGWRGHADFLERRDDTPSDLGDYSYEVLDTKLARSAKPYFVLQLCCYSEMVAAVQGVMPAEMHVVLGTGERKSFRIEEFAAYYRRVRARLLDQVVSPDDPPYPFPCAHCSLCSWAPRCVAKREEDDHLSLVANARRGQVLKLEAGGIATLAALGEAAPDARPDALPETTWHKLRRQAALQLAERRGGEPLRELVEPVEAGRGFTLLPDPDPGDVFFDLEGDPFVEHGLEYLWGWETRDGSGEWRFDRSWAHDHDGERAAFEAFVDLLIARHDAHPAMHAYHYAHYEPAALKRLASTFATREAEVDRLLREEVLVDLYAVVRQGLVISRPGYGLKEVERFYLDGREADVQDAGGSIVAYERWLDERDQSILDEIERYNAEDVASTRLLRDWLLPLREAAFAQGIAEPAAEREPYVPSDETVEARAETARLRAGLLRGVPDEPGTGDDEQEARRLLAHLLDYHEREARPVWWAFFARREMTEGELLEDAEVLAGLEPDPERPPRSEQRSIVRTFRFGPQEHKLRVGDTVHDPLLPESPGVGTVVGLDDEAGAISIKRGEARDGDLADHRALAPGGPIGTREQRAALRRLAAAVVDGTGRLDGDGPYPALRGLLLRDRPTVAGLEPGAPLQGEHVSTEHATDVIGRLSDSALMVQGPPGSGKTYTGARVIAELLRRGSRVGVASTSHKAINKLLAEVEEVCVERGIELHGVKKFSGEGSRYERDGDRDLIVNTDQNDVALGSGHNLVGGTAWLFCREEAGQAFDHLFLDEAGQISLADALAMGTAARNLVLLGDPQQLAQVSQAVHPPGGAASVLEHLLGDRATVPPDEGLFLADTFRMHPDVCRFVSEMAYEGRLESAPEAVRRDISGGSEPWTGTGLRFVRVEHEGNRTSSREEAVRVAEIVGRLCEATFADADGTRRPVALDDILVVAPYNAQVRCLTAELPDGAKIGTVDKFQGQQAPVTIYSLATSSGEELPRNLEFLFSRNRLNVAISRAQCLSIVVASPRLLDIDCGTIDQMRLVNELCRLGETAQAA